ncbi:MAG TPA: hypothetical protein VEX38_04215 [Fimbriimonadaceae bacterium]|nr:hypothetical protein [Fimbriimonadaceae bacterium]
MIKAVTVDGMMSGTGIRDSVNGGYLELDNLPLSSSLKRQITEWLSKYENAHYFSFEDASEVETLDLIGLNIARAIKEEVSALEVRYYSSARLKELKF